MKCEYLKTHDFIKNRWKDGVKENLEGEYSLPFPFEPPCIDGLFLCIFYWDTYYTNKGLIRDGYFDIAKNNVDNLIYLLIWEFSTILTQLSQPSSNITSIPSGITSFSFTYHSPTVSANRTITPTNIN